MSRPLVVGEIAYLNVLPLFDAWRAAAGVGPQDDPPGVRIVRGDPVALNGALARGEVDVAPCSSLEYARDPERYRLLPDLSIAADGAVESVLLFARRPLEALAGEAARGRRPVVALSPASATSNVLTRVLLAERGVGAEYVQRPASGLVPGAPRNGPAADAAVVIGDEALAAAADGAAVARAAGFPHVYDLGLLWRDLTGLPFVFALWIARADAAAEAPAALARLGADLLAAKQAARARFGALAAREAGRASLAPSRLLAYWAGLCYDLGPREREGLLAYFRLAAAHGHLPGVPPLRFATGLPGRRTGR